MGIVVRTCKKRQHVDVFVGTGTFKGKKYNFYECIICHTSRKERVKDGK